MSLAYEPSTEPLRGFAKVVEGSEGEFFIDNLLARIHFIIEMIWWTGLALWEFGFPFPGSLTSTFQSLGLCGLPNLALALSRSNVDGCVLHTQHVNLRGNGKRPLHVRSQVPYKCHLEEVVSVGDWLKICPWVASRVVYLPAIFRFSFFQHPEP